MAQIRVHELASELGVSTQEVLSYVQELGKKVRGPSTVLGVSVAAKVRGRFRASRPAAPVAAPTVADRPAGGPAALFLPPVAPRVGALAPGAATFANPFAVPVAQGARPPVPRPVAAAQQGVDREVTLLPVETRPGVEQNHDDVWRRRGFDQVAQDLWCGNGVRPFDAELADRCRSVGIAPTDLPLKLSGRSVLQRLRDGESTTSVWARIQEAEQQPRRAGTKLTGRFQLG